MTRFPYDQFVKEYLPELINKYGKATSSAKIKGEIREIDVLFIPNQELPTTPDTLGLLGKLAQKPCLFEVFRNPVTTNQIRSCLDKLCDVHANTIREAHRNQQQIKEENLPNLWIISPTVSDRILGQCQVRENPDNWGKGIYTTWKVRRSLPRKIRCLSLFRYLGSDRRKPDIVGCS